MYLIQIDFPYKVRVIFFLSKYYSYEAEEQAIKPALLFLEYSRQNNH